MRGANKRASTTAGAAAVTPAASKLVLQRAEVTETPRRVVAEPAELAAGARSERLRLLRASPLASVREGAPSAAAAAVPPSPSTFFCPSSRQSQSSPLTRVLRRLCSVHS